jgi:NADPH2 dehydrogenase
MSGLFSELDVAGRRLINRIVLPPMATERAQENGNPSAATVDWYADVAKAGMALVVVEHSFVAPEGRLSPKQLSFASDDVVQGHRAVADAIHAAGCLCAAQINHAGANRRPEMPGRTVGASAIAYPGATTSPEELTALEIAGIVRSFGDAARRVREAGYDFVEVHCAHGYLLSQFLSPLTNHRSDAYGGTPARRQRLLLEVVEEVKAVVAGDLPIMVRLGMADNPPSAVLYEGGLTLTEGVLAARALDQAGVAILDLSAGICGSRPAGITGEAYYRAFADAVRPAVRCRTVCTAGITMPATADDIVRSGTADLVGIGRALAADHEWIRRARTELGGAS